VSVHHTSRATEARSCAGGDWALAIGCVLIVLQFQHSSRSRRRTASP